MEDNDSDEVSLVCFWVKHDYKIPGWTYLHQTSVGVVRTILCRTLVLFGCWKYSVNNCTTAATCEYFSAIIRLFGRAETMSSIYPVVEICLAVMLCLVAISNGKSLSKQKVDYEINLKSDENVRLLQHQSSIQHFANNGLCRHLYGQQYLQKAMKTKLTNVNDSLVTQFVSQLCASRGIMLEMWVKELFDSDGDGHLNHFEIHYYESNA